MKTTSRWLFVLLSILLFQNCGNKDSDNDSTNQSIAQEDSTNTKKTASIEKLPQELGFEYTYPENVLKEGENELYPIGFSADGLFAFLERSCDLRGCVTHEIIVQELKTDKIKASFNLNRNEENVEDFEKQWRVRNKQVTEFLKANGISQTKMNLETGLPIERQGQLFNIVISKKLEKMKQNNEYEDEGWDIGLPPLKYSMRVTMDGKKPGTLVATGKIDGGENVRYLGLIQSPYTNQAVLIIEESLTGFENITERKIRNVGVTFDKALF